jgi:asparagine synthase (glutamine-hydrolysing)
MLAGPPAVSARDVWAMLASIRHRGPDGAGVATFSGPEASVSRSEHESIPHGAVGLGHVRLAIIDLSEAGFQPMSDEEGRVWVTFNGEIYNFAELRRDLACRGHRFRSRTDTEVLVHGWQEWGEGLLERIEGMFAFALHDRDSGVSLLARDRLGIKPLYYATRPDGAFAAASEIKALLAAGVTAELELESLNRYLAFLWVPEPDTAFAGVRSLPPGHVLRLVDGRPIVEAYWDFVYEPEGDDPAWHAAELRAATEAAVSRQLVSDVPVGAFFSGGVDSTAIVELMRRERGASAVSCFSVGFSKRDLSHDVIHDDLRYTRRYAKDTGVDYREAILSPDLTASLPEVVRHLDEPIADPAALSAYQICGAASDEFTVLLSGMGGDEIFGGYLRYVAIGLAARFRSLPGPMRSALGALAAPLPSAGSGRLGRFGSRAHRLLETARRPFPDDYLGFLTHLDAPARNSLYTPQLAAALSGADADATHRAHLDRVAGEHWLNQAMYLDLKTFLASHNLTYMDRMSMAHSIEVRVPLIDELIVSVMRRVPPAGKLSGQATKIAFKQAMQGIVPDEIIRRPKAGFAAPARGWLANELRPMVDDLLSADTVRSRGLFRPEAVDRLIKDFRSGARDNAFPIWQLLTLELWHQAFLDAPARTMAHAGAAA